ncbi:MAG: PAS domain-containing protein [Rhizobiaceae bacterium]|nr:PAS domain-containing protein [Rhizobiaceae bacterium]
MHQRRCVLRLHIRRRRYFLVAFTRAVVKVAFEVSSHPSLLPLFEAVSLKNSQLQQAIRVGDDHLVRLLDRELDPLIAAVVDYHASDIAEIHMQLRFIGSLIREDADDRSCVQRHAAVLSILLDRYFGDVRERGRSPSSLALAELGARMDGEDNYLNESILNSMPDRVAVVTLDYRFLYCNPAHAEWLGATQLDLVGRNLFDFVDDGQVAQDIRQQLDRCFAGERSEVCYWWRSAGIGIALRSRAAPLRTPRGDVIGAILTVLEDERMAGEIAA